MGTETGKKRKRGKAKAQISQNKKFKSGEFQNESLDVMVKQEYCPDEDVIKSEELKDTKKAQKPKTEHPRAHLTTHRLSKGEDPASVTTMTALLVCSDNKKWYCGFCLEEFGKLKEFHVHIKEMHEGKRYKCDLCKDFRSTELRQVAKHKLSKHSIITETFQRHACDVVGCSYQTVIPTDLDFHKKMLHSEEYASKTQCTICGLRTLALRTHIETVHMGVRPYICQHCNKSFLTRGNLKNHVNSTHSEVPKAKVICNLCGAENSNEQGLKQHMKRKHTIGDEQFQCTECPKSFNLDFLLKEHVKRCHPESWIPCPKCDKKVQTALKLRGHFLSTHLKVSIKPYSCVSCGQAYTRAKDCWVHIALKHDISSNDKSQKDYWKLLSREKQELMEKKDCRKEENAALKGHIHDQYLCSEA